MKLKTFKLEDFYGKHEFSVQHMLSSSDAQTWTLQDILSMASLEERNMWDEQSFGYTQVKGLPLLRDEIAKSYPGLTADNVLCFAGAEDAIFCTLLALCDAQDHVIVITPCYQSLQEVPQFRGASLTTIPLEEKNAWRIDMYAIEKAIQANTKVVVINFPHNPTGQIITKEELQELINLLEQYGIWLVSDEVYHGLGSENLSWVSPAACLYSKAISIGVMSKSFGLPGLRIGWISCQDQKFLHIIEQTKHYTSLCNSGPAEIISLIALRNKNIFLQRNNEIREKNIKLFDVFIEKYKDLFSWIRPQGGCTGFVRYHGKLSVEDFCCDVIEKAQILLLPGSVYGQDWADYFRIGFGRENFEQVLLEFEKYLENKKE